MLAEDAMVGDLISSNSDAGRHRDWREVPVSVQTEAIHGMGKAVVSTRK